MKRTRLWIFILLVLAGAAAAYLLIDRNKGGENTVSIEEAGASARFCDLGRQLDQIALSTGAASQPGAFDGPPEAVGQLLTEFEPRVPEFRESAPREVEGDVGSVISSLERARDGDAQVLASNEFRRANDNVHAYLSRSCPDAGTSGEG